MEEARVPGKNKGSLRVKLDRKRISEKLWDRLGFEPTFSATEVYWLSALPLSDAGAQKDLTGELWSQIITNIWFGTAGPNPA